MNVGPLNDKIDPATGKYYIDGGTSYIQQHFEAVEKDNDLLYVTEAYQEMQQKMHDHQLKLAELRDEFWQRQAMSEAQYREALAELDHDYQNERIMIASFGDSYHYNFGAMAPHMVKDMTREEYEAAIEEFISSRFEAETTRVKQIKLKRRLEAEQREKNREIYGAFGDIADLSDLVTEKPKRRDTWWSGMRDNLLDILYWLMDWIAPPNDKRKNDE